MVELQALVRLQAVDTALDTARTELTQIEQQLGENDAVRAAREGVSEAQRQLRESERQARDLEYAIQNLSEKIKTDEGRLYGGQVSSRDLQALQREIEHLRTERSRAEDESLAMMEQIEQNQRAVVDAEKVLAAAQGTWEQEQADMIARRAALGEEISRLEAQRADLDARLTAPTRVIYEDLRRTRRGQAVVPVERNLCRGCRISVPSSLIPQVRMGRQVVRCPSCGRILVMER